LVRHGLSGGVPNDIVIMTHKALSESYRATR
jgi:hypothetical protein